MKNAQTIKYISNWSFYEQNNGAAKFSLFTAPFLALLFFFF